MKPTRTNLEKRLANLEAHSHTAPDERRPLRPEDVRAFALLGRAELARRIEEKLHGTAGTAVLNTTDRAELNRQIAAACEG